MTEPQRVLVMAPNWLGDAVMALPAIQDLRRHFSSAHFVIGARSSVATLFRAVPGIDEIVLLRASSASRDSLRADVGVLLPNSFRSAWTLKQAGVKERWGYGADLRGWLLTKSVRRPRKKMHFGEYYQNLVRQLGCENGPLRPKLTVPRSRIDAASSLLQENGWVVGQPVVAIAPGAAFGHAKRWPAERYAAVADSLKKEAGAVAVIVGRSEDRDAAAGITGIDLIGKTDLLMLMGVLSHCRALVANDSGALHLAAAIGIPVTAIYGPTDERYSRPLSSIDSSADRVQTLFEPVFCRPCGLRDCPIDHRCMRRIPPERVSSAVLSQLQMETGI